MNSKQLFEIALGNIQPWFLTITDCSDGKKKAIESCDV